jgi:tRNA threonylcarbamoyladenosine biosynthesis protein TsaB
VAAAGHSQGKVLAALDAGRNEIYTGEYEVGEAAAMLSEHLLTREEFLASAGGRTVITPDTNIASAARDAGLQVEEVERPHSDAIARIGWKKILAGDTISPEALEANYIRRSDAEIFSKGKI